MSAEVPQPEPPLIEVRALTKRYGRQVAVADVSFTVGAGEVVGLLGPNGAGKSTILRVLACFLPATSGTVRVAGRDVFLEADAVRRQIGYMPENNPLYPDLRVGEYLRFRARLKGLSRAAGRARVDAVLEQCGLMDVTRKIIGTLSKGYRQRVGLADALVHEPRLLLLDEPTIGLDPHQLRAVRDMIRALARERTIVISSHILPEIEATCGRVLILHAGRILADDTPAHLRQQLRSRGEVVFEMAAPRAELEACWAEHPDVERCACAPVDDGYVRCVLTPRGANDLRPAVYALAVARGWPLRELTRGQQSLEEIYLRLTRPEPEAEE
jgi:ABC-2 type transport system ATP-binding protein